MSNLLLTCLFILSGCAIGPTGQDLKEYFEKPKFKDNLAGKLIVINKTGFKKWGPNYDIEPETLIKNEVARDDKVFLDRPTSGEFRFTYYECTETKKFPTQYTPVNILVYALTLTIVPTGTQYACKVDLDVTLPDSKKTEHYSLNMETDASARFFLLGYFDEIPKKNALWKLSARRLLKMYEEKKSFP